MRFFYTLLILLSFASLSAQVSDDFSDGDFTNNPTWSGDTGEWEVLNGELHLNNAAPASSNFSHLSTPSAALSDGTWEFLVRMDFNPSGVNYVDIFLASDIADLEGSVNGYFVRLGGSTDEISLYESTTGSPSEIIDGTDDKLDVNNPIAYVRVTRDALGNWSCCQIPPGQEAAWSVKGRCLMPPTPPPHSSVSTPAIHLPVIPGATSTT